MKSLRAIREFQNVPIIVRAGLNEPVDIDGVVRDTFRLERALPTLQFLQSKGACVIVISHIDPPDGAKALGTETLEPLAKKLGELIANVSFCRETIGPVVEAAIAALAPGHILVLENLRRNPGEVANDPEFAKQLATLGQAFVQDSFDTCHREHASIVTLPKLLPAYAGLLLEQEIRQLAAARVPQAPSLAVIGGAKFSTKEPVLEALLNRYDHVFVGGALANDFLAAKGLSVGKSVVSGADSAAIKKLLENKKIILPVDSLVAPAESARREAARTANLTDVAPGEMILDHGPATSTLLGDIVSKSKNILWNGPLGNYENGFIDATDALALAIAQSSAHSVVGGGDTIASIQKLSVLDKFSFVSTGGGAMLDFLAAGTLPGLTALD